MNSVGADAFIIPEHLFPRVPRYVPHLYTPEELSAIFSDLDQVQPNKRYPTRHLVIPVMFRMIYCCGLRPKEGRTILRRNVDLESGRVLIQAAKKNKDRVIVMSPDMLKLCQRYDTIVDKIVSSREHFFPGPHGVYTMHGLKEIFQKCLKNTGLVFSGNRPRTYDLRHTFATNVLYRWMKEGKDINAHLPYLSAYLGHENFSDTAYYIHLVPQYFSQISDMCLSQHSHLIPEIENEN